MLGVVLLALALFFTIAGFGAGGVVGHSTKEALVSLLGIGYALAPILFAVLGMTFIRSGRPQVRAVQILGSLLLLVGSLGLIDVASQTSHSAGAIGQFFGYIFVTPFETLGAIIFLGAILIISLVILFDTRPTMTIFNSFLARFEAWRAERIKRKLADKKLVITGGEEAAPEAATAAVPEKKVEKKITPLDEIPEEVEIETPKKSPKSGRPSVVGGRWPVTSGSWASDDR